MLSILKWSSTLTIEISKNKNKNYKMPLKKENKYNMLKFSKFRRDKDLIQT